MRTGTRNGFVTATNVTRLFFVVHARGAVRCPPTRPRICIAKWLNSRSLSRRGILPTSILQGSDGYLYGTTEHGGALVHSVPTLRIANTETAKL
jgi:hypothetical protein